MFIVLANYKQIWYWCICWQNSSNNVKKVDVAIRWVNHCFHAFIKHHYNCHTFFEKIICSFYLLHLASLCGIKCYKQWYCLEIFVHTPSMIQWIVRIYEFVDKFLWKLFWFFKKFFLIKSKSWIILNLSAITVRVNSVFLRDLRPFFLEKKRM